ncbi:MAG: MoaD/ThiS family protein [Rudaea sp.]
MRIIVRLYGNLRRYAGNRRDRTEMDVEEKITVRSLLNSLGVPENDWWMAAVNDRVVDAEETLNEGDLVEIFDPVGGGVGEPVKPA